MSEDKSLPVGRFVWHDLVTTDVPKALDYYRDLLGWEYTQADMGGFQYNMIRVAGTEHGGFVPVDPGDPQGARWTSYAVVPDVDAACAKATELGGTLVVPPTDIPGEVGRFAVLVSPTGAGISPYKPVHPQGDPADTAVAGTFCWHELLSADPDADGPFFREVFGWSGSSQPMGELGTYHLFLRGEGRQSAGMLKNPQAGIPSTWVPYITVDDIDATAKRVEELGGKIWVAPQDIPNMGRFTVTSDPQGAMIAFFKGETKAG
jgi:predicted enzyme related to lactoylglutathione lyase